MLVAYYYKALGNLAANLHFGTCRAIIYRYTGNLFKRRPGQSFCQSNESAPPCDHFGWCQVIMHLLFLSTASKMSSQNWGV